MPPIWWPAISSRVWTITDGTSEKQGVITQSSGKGHLYLFVLTWRANIDSTYSHGQSNLCVRCVRENRILRGRDIRRSQDGLNVDKSALLSAVAPRTS